MLDMFNKTDKNYNADNICAVYRYRTIILGRNEVVKAEKMTIEAEQAKIG